MIYKAYSEKGTCYIGDPSMLLNESIYKYNLDAYHEFNDGQYTIDNCSYAVHHTKHGDGRFAGLYHKFNVESGMLAVIPEELFIGRDKCITSQLAVVHTHQVTMKYNDGVFILRDADGSMCEVIDTNLDGGSNG